MMTTVVVTLQSDRLPEPVDLELPGEVPLAQMLPVLVRALQLPPGDYALVHRGRQLLADETLFASGVLMGEVLALVGGEEPKPPVRAQETGPASPIRLTDLLPLHAVETAQGSGRAVALWSGPAGGTGQTTLALALAILAAEQRIGVALLALSEPAISAYLHLPRVPNAAAFFESGRLSTAEQEVVWRISQQGAVEHTLSIVLGPTGRERGAGEAEQVAALVAAARAAHPVVLIDLPPLTPGEDKWVWRPLSQASDLVLVALPTVAGVATTVEALSWLHNREIAACVHLVLSHRSPGGLSRASFTAGVEAVWGRKPDIAAVIPFLPQLAGQMDRGPFFGIGLEASGMQAPSADQRELAGAARELANILDFGGKITCQPGEIW